MAADGAPEVLIRPGRITLNRPQALHALTLAMVRQITATLLAWRGDAAVRAVIVEHGGGRGFSAGGDVRAIVESLRGDGSHARAFFFEEYRMNHLLFHYPKPLVCFWDGIVMGGGAGLALPCRYRVATENTRFAMPECAIGLFPDVGASWYLSRLPGITGEWLALTGTRLGAAECLELGLVTHAVAAAQQAEVKAAIEREPEKIDDILMTLPPPSWGRDSREAAGRGKSRDGSTLPPPASLREAPSPIKEEGRLEELISTISAFDSSAADKIARASPVSLAVAARALSEARGMRSFAEVMRMEYRVARRIIARPDFREGVRAFIEAKDNAPRWRPATRGEVTDETIESIFAPLPSDEEWQLL